MCTFGKRRHEEWKYIFVEGKESNFVQNETGYLYLIREGSWKRNLNVKKDICRKFVEMVSLKSHLMCGQGD